MNGDLLDAAEKAGFEILLTGDKTIEYEQNMKGRKIAVVALSAPHWPIVKDHIPKIAMALSVAKAGTFNRVDVGRFLRPRRKRMPELGL